MPCKKVAFFYISIFVIIIAHLTCSGFNMGNDLAVFVTFAAFLVNGNPLTNLMSIGGKTPLTGPDPPQPAEVGGLDTHNVFEGTIFRIRFRCYYR